LPNQYGDGNPHAEPGQILVAGLEAVMPIPASAFRQMEVLDFCSQGLTDATPALLDDGDDLGCWSGRGTGGAIDGCECGGPRGEQAGEPRGLGSGSRGVEDP
jgi:hypothetical protein